MKRKKSSRNKNTSTYRTLNQNKNSQMITLMGILLVVTVFTMASLAADITNLDIVISSERAISLLPEFICIKDSFCHSLNYNLADNITIQNNEMLFYGNISNITEVFSYTTNEYYLLELQHDILFDAQLNDCWVVHSGSTDGVYYLNVTLSLENRNTRYTEDVLYSIMCKPGPMG